MDEERDKALTDTEARRTIARLAADTLPRLIERLTRSELGELEVREDGWRIRLRRAEGVNGAAGTSAAEPRDRGRHSASLTSAGHQDRAGGHRTASVRRPESNRGLVTSPAVGYFVARDGVSVGARVSQGDLIGQVDVLGVSQEVVAPIEGTIGSFDVEPGQAIEYGQPLARIGPAGRRAATAPSAADEPVMGQLVEA